MSVMDLLRAAALTTQLCERRTDLIRLFGEATYQERTALAKARIREVMTLRHDDNALSAAIAFCKDLAARHPGADVSTAQQFVLCAAADLAEGR